MIESGSPCSRRREEADSLIKSITASLRRRLQVCAMFLFLNQPCGIYLLLRFADSSKRTVLPGRMRTEKAGIILPRASQLHSIQKNKGDRFQNKNLVIEIPPSRNH